MSIGVNLIAELCKRAATVLEDDFDIEIVEAHHNQKLDAPSGTANMLADAVMEGCNNKKSWYTTVTSAARNAKRMKSVCTPFAAVPLWANIRSSLPAETK